jgi:hypothetical protein
MTGVNRGLIQDEKEFGKALFRIFYKPYSGFIQVNTTPTFSIPDDINAEEWIDNLYASNSLYFLNSTENLAIEIELYDFLESEVPENKLEIKDKKTIRVIVKGLGIKSSFTRLIHLHPTIHPFTDSTRETRVGGGLYGAEYGEDPTDFIPPQTYQINRTDLGITDWELQGTAKGDKYANENFKKSWLARLHGDIIDMAFFIETNE